MGMMDNFSNFYYNDYNGIAEDNRPLYHANDFTSEINQHDTKFSKEYKDTTEITDIFDLGRDSCNEEESPEKRKIDTINEFPTWITITDPMTGKVYQIPREKLSKMLREHGTKQNSPPTSQTTKALIQKLCSAKCDRVTEADVEKLLKSGYKFHTVTNRDQPTDRNSEKLICKICAVIEPGPPKLLNNKENLKRHYQRHCNHTRFKCKLCGEAKYRKDILREHLKKHHKLTDKGEIILNIIETDK